MLAMAKHLGIINPSIKFLMGIELRLSPTPSSCVAMAFSLNLLNGELRDRLPMGLLSLSDMEFLSLVFFN